jgi:hypothetical protein
VLLIVTLGGPLGRGWRWPRLRRGRRCDAGDGSDARERRRRGGLQRRRSSSSSC